MRNEVRYTLRHPVHMTPAKMAFLRSETIHIYTNKNNYRNFTAVPFIAGDARALVENNKLVKLNVEGTNMAVSFWKERFEAGARLHGIPLRKQET